MIIRNGFLLAALVAAPAFATEPPPATVGSPDSGTAPVKDEGIICERVAETGSLVRKREVCTTRAQREQASHDNKEMLHDMSRRVATDRGE